MLALYALLPLLGFTLAAPLEKRWDRVRIVSGRDGKCLTAAPKTGVGSPVYTADCNSALLWSISPGSGSVTLGSLALDAGDNPQNGGQLKVWTSYPGLYQQTWYLTDDNRIAITGGDQCLDEGDNGVQTWQCTGGDTNQVWYIQDENGQPPPSASASSSSAAASSSEASSTTSSSSAPSPSVSNPIPEVPYGPVYPDPDGGGRRIRIDGRPDLAVTVQGGYAGRGAAVDISAVFSNNDTFLDEQLWDLPQGTGQVKLHAKPYFCLDAGTDPANGSGIKIYDCLDVPQQQWTFQNGQLSLPQDVGQCLDVKSEWIKSINQPYSILKYLQTWQCSQPDVFQHFAVYATVY